MSFSFFVTYEVLLLELSFHRIFKEIIYSEWIGCSEGC